MATLLTENYQWLGVIRESVQSGPSTSGGYWYCTYYATVYGRYISQNTTTNKTTVQFKIVLSGNQSSSAYAVTHSGSGSFSGGVEGSTNYDTTHRANTTYVICEKQADIEHSVDGKLTYTQNASFYSSVLGSGSGSFEVTVPDIPRKATVTAGTDFNDEGNPTVTFSNPANFTTKPYLKFYDSSNTLVHTITGSTGVTSPYTWELTNAQRTSLRTATNKQQTYTVEEGIETFNGSTSLGSTSIKKTFSIINAVPTATHTITETDAKVSAVFGTTGATVVKGVSDIKVTVTPSLKKGATIKSTNIKLGSSTLTSSPATFSNVTNGSLSYTVTDSRSNSVTRTATLNVVDYISVSIDSCEFRRKAVGSNVVVLDAVVTVNTGTVGGETNTLTVSYSSSNDRSGTITTYTTGTNKITISNLELGTLVSDGEVAAFTLTVSDLFTSASATNNVIIPVPVLEAGIHDVQVNGDLYLADMAGTNRANIKSMIKNVEIYRWEDE